MWPSNEHTPPDWIRRGRGGPFQSQHGTTVWPSEPRGVQRARPRLIDQWGQAHGSPHTRQHCSALDGTETLVDEPWGRRGNAMSIPGLLLCDPTSMCSPEWPRSEPGLGEGHRGSCPAEHDDKFGYGLRGWPHTWGCPPCHRTLPMVERTNVTCTYLAPFGDTALSSGYPSLSLHLCVIVHSEEPAAPLGRYSSGPKGARLQRARAPGEFQSSASICSSGPRRLLCVKSLTSEPRASLTILHGSHQEWHP